MVVMVYMTVKRLPLHTLFAKGYDIVILNILNGEILKTQYLCGCVGFIILVEGHTLDDSSSCMFIAIGPFGKLELFFPYGVIIKFDLDPN